MKKEIYEKPSMMVFQVKYQTMLLAGSGSYTDPEPTPPNEIPDYDDWIE